MIRGRRELKAMWRDPKMKLLIDSLWREYYALYTEKYKSQTDLDELGEPIDQWIRNKISRDINFAQAIGQGHNLEGNRSAAIGQGGHTTSFMELLLGAYPTLAVDQDPENWITTDRLLALGNGLSDVGRSLVFEILKNGFFKFLQSIKIGPAPALAEGQTPENGTLQWTPENGLEIWDVDHWESVGATHLPVTINPSSAAFASIDPETHVLTVTEPTWGLLPDKPTAFSPSVHAHPISDVTGLTTALLNKLETSLKGSVNGLAELDSNGFVLNTQLPSYVDDVLEFINFAAFPLIGESGKIYITQDTNITYRWSGTAYAEISASLALGETSATAYRGDRGKTAYDYSQIGHVTLIDGRVASWTAAYNWGNHAAAGYGLASALTTHAGLTTTAHGLGASAFHDDNYFAPASGSTNYVNVSPISAQSGDIWMNGSIKSKVAIVNTITAISESNIIEIRTFNDANLVGAVSYNQDDDNMRIANKSSYGGSKLSFATNNVDRYAIDVNGNHDFKTGTAKFGNLAGTTTRLSAVTSDGTIASITNGTEGQVMKIVGGVPAFGTLTIPTLTSQLTNNSGFVTSDTNNYPTSLSYSGTTLTLGRNGLSNLTATISGAGMVYPSGSGIPIISGGSSWGTTITNNSSNWNTAFTNMGKVRLNGGGAFNLLDAVYFNEASGVVGLNTSSLVGQDPYLPITSLAVQQALSSYQSTLVSGTNIKTVNGASLLGSGNIALADVNGNYANYFRLDRLYFGSATAWNMWGGGTTLEFNYNGVTKATLTSSGVFTAQEVYRGSSRTLKHDIEPLITSALEMINQTLICSYKMNADNSFAVGFIAEDTHPWLSGTDQKRHNFGNHLGLLTKAIQEEDVKIVALERKVKDLENELNQLKHGRG